MNRGTIWRAAFPLIAEGLRIAGVEVIARPRQRGKTTDLLAMAAKDSKAIMLCPNRQMVQLAERIYERSYPQGTLRITTVEELERNSDGMPPANLYIDEGALAFPETEFLHPRRYVIKAVAYSCS